MDRYLLAEAGRRFIRNPHVAQAEAKKIEAEAAVIQAEADVLRAQGMAVAEAIRTETRLKAELRKTLEQRGIDWAAELDGDRLRVAFTKKRREITDQSE